MKIKKIFKPSNIIFILLLILLLVPQSRQFIQVALHKGLSYINPVSKIDDSSLSSLENYNLTLLKENESLFNLEDVKGKVILINFWATWCPPCIAEMQSLQKLYDAYKDDIVFLFITNDSKSKTEQFKSKNNYSFPVYRILNDVPKILQTKSIPRTLIINKEGKIVIDKYGAANWFSASVKEKIDRILNK